MQLAGLNYIAIMLAAGASFAFGGIWYGILSRLWMKAAGVTMDDIRARDSSAVTPYVITYLAQLVMAGMLASVIALVSAADGSAGLLTGLKVAASMWLGFVATSLIVNHTFQMQSRTLTLIDGGHWLGVLLLQGAVLAGLGPG